VADLLAPLLGVVHVFWIAGLAGPLQIGQHAQGMHRPEGVRLETDERLGVAGRRVRLAELQ
jgi:hypothetical protein